MQFTSLTWHFLFFWSCQNVFVPCNACARGEHLHVYTFLVSKSTAFHAACFAARDLAESFAFLDPNHMGRTGNVLGSWCVVWYTTIPS